MMVGASGEDLVVGLLDRAGLSWERSEGRFPDWDLLSSLHGRRFTLEVKFDLREAQTGNIAIEFKNTKSGEPSGLKATRADLWAHVVRPGRVFLGRVSDLKAFIENSRPCRVVSGAGDDNADIWLYRRERVLGPVLRDTDGLGPSSLFSLFEELLWAKAAASTTPP